MAWVCQKIEIRSKRFKGTPSFNAIRSSWEFKALPDPEHFFTNEDHDWAGEEGEYWEEVSSLTVTIENYWAHE